MKMEFFIFENMTVIHHYQFDNITDICIYKLPKENH